MNKVTAQPAQVSGEASVIRAKPAVLTATIQVTRAETGKVDEYTLTATLPDQPEGELP